MSFENTLLKLIAANLGINESALMVELTVAAEVHQRWARVQQIRDAMEQERRQISRRIWAAMLYDFERSRVLSFYEKRL